jgi:hypothetical protein
MNKIHEVSEVYFSEKEIHLTIDGEKKNFRIEKVSQILANATDQEKKMFEISPSGYGIHWPLIDVDISIDGLLGIVHKKVKRSNPV